MMDRYLYYIISYIYIYIYKYYIFKTLEVNESFSTIILTESLELVCM